ncbi:MAG: DUF6516 family protein [Bacteroidota bacterium]
MSDLEILKWLEKSPLVKSFDVLEFKQKLSSVFLKLKVVFVDNSVLFTKEYFDAQSRNYSYHWQDNNKKLIMRWDNAPHHKNISTFPHHVHIKEDQSIHDSNVIALIEVFKYIETQLKQ